MRTERWTALAGALAALAFCLAAGCSSRPAPLAPVTGKVLYANLALQGGTVVFTPDTTRGTRGEMAVGKIQPDGSYRLRTGEAEGAAPGYYRVTVAAVAAGSGIPGQPFDPPHSLLPEKYRDPQLSGLECEVKPGITNTINFELN